MSTNNMNSSALSDDGKFSTRALRGFGTSDLDYNYNYNVEQPLSRMQGRGNTGGEMDAMGLST